MSQTFVPASEAEIVEIVRSAIASGGSLRVAGADTKSGWGRPVQASGTLSLTGLSGIDLYEPEELVLSARVGTKMAELEQRLAQHGQQFAFEPPDLGPLFGKAAGEGSLGGAIGCNLAGPRRISAGAARDHLLGFSAVNGLGDAFKAGGRVVKNVTGFDLAKLLSGSFGTLAAMTQVTVKVLPAPEDSCTVLVAGLDPAAAVEAMGLALRSPHEVSGAAFLPAGVAARARLGALGRGATSATLLRLEGAGPSVAARRMALLHLLKDRGTLADLSVADSRLVWREIRDVASLIGDGPRAIWHISVPPAAGAKIVHEITEAHDDFYLDWGGGRIWLASASDAVRAAERIRHAISGVGGHATLIRADEEARLRVSVFQPPPRVEAALAQRLKDNFDPHRIFNPGRMYEGL
jgi:glycolate oxidase FAD binding subunit